jgi:hypothetical protein
VLRTLVALVTAVVLFFAGSMAFVVWATRDARHAGVAPLDPAPPDPGAGSGGAAPVLPPPAPEAVTPGGGPSPERAVAAFASPGPDPADGIHRPARTEAPRRKALRDFRLELKTGLSELQMRVQGCSVVDASFQLDVESVEGGVRVVSAAVESPGRSSPADVACAQSMLRGQVIPAASVEPGRRWRLPFAVRAAM